MAPGVSARWAGGGVMLTMRPWLYLDPRLDHWLDLYERVARANRANPTPAAASGRARAAKLLGGHGLGIDLVLRRRRDTGVVGRTWADRVTQSAFGEQAVRDGHATLADLDAIADAWRRWADAPDGWFSVLNGEVLCRP